MQYPFRVDVTSYHVKMEMFYNVQTANLTIVGRKLRYTVKSYSIA